ncbi:MAG: nuclear transport factor 2 family protein [Chloroflexota bacterium]|nr:nuclear transport factor 2 family protein [Chloroflexota bacterium]
MTFGYERDVREEILQLMKNINDAWVRGRSEELEEYFHEDIVFQGRTKGRRPCVDSYREFTDHATIREFKESDFSINIWGNTAVVTYDFKISYIMDAWNYQDSGQDSFVFIWEGDRWRAVWRMVVLLSAEK